MRSSFSRTLIKTAERVVMLTQTDPSTEATYWTATMMPKRDVVRLYVDPPAHAIVLSVDEIQSIDRSYQEHRSHNGGPKGVTY
jgi:hypothetical protein